MRMDRCSGVGMQSSMRGWEFVNAVATLLSIQGLVNKVLSSGLGQIFLPVAFDKFSLGVAGGIKVWAC